ncbi:hypothetical protein H6G94_03930 [Nostoc punctiforme FACHB-252]|jgi:predicted DNA-binding protein|uniref:CopG domain protein DNA-binding domain protein n=1 Tax=Nostoc punctiforme FACHB-252 TaxID=1357509 RepID=A0ABR8H5D6_NOSPU|nr:hypothetical protein [Nostoc punctiforme]MBD2610430.1 hypothetical protein [Nostoc punctiforme FACHB-252]
MPRTRTQTRQTAIRFDQDTWEWLEQEAQRTNKPISGLIREGIELLKTEVRVLANLKAQLEASGVTYPAMKTQTAKGVKKRALMGFNVS